MSMATGCTTLDSFTHTFLNPETEDNTDKTITIGVFEPQTGRYADEGLSEIKGIELANSIYNSVNGYQVQLVKVDTQSRSNAAETAIQGLIEMDPVAIIGSASEANSLVASKYVDKAHIPTITPSATNPLITQNCRYYFRASMTNNQMGEGIADYVYNELGSSHIGVITSKNDTMAAALLNGFDKMIKKYAKRNSDEDSDDDSDDDEDSDSKKSPVVMSEESELTGSDMNKLIRTAMKKDVDTLLIPLGTEAMDKFFKRVEKAGWKDVTFIGTSSWGDKSFVDMMEGHKGIKIAFPYDSVIDSSNALSEEAQKFCIEYANLYGSEDVPTQRAALGYDSYLLLMNAMHNARSMMGKDIRQALLELKDVKCTTGVFSFDENGNNIRNVNICTIEDGKIVSLHITDAKTEAQTIEGVNE